MLNGLENKQVIIYAAGNAGRTFCRALKAHGIIPEFFIDINADKIKEAEGVFVYKRDDIPETIDCNSIVVYSPLIGSKPSTFSR